MFPCHFAAMAHKLFAFELERAVDGAGDAECDPALVADPGACELGRWIAANAGELSHLPHFRALRETHSRFHDIAGEMICRLRRGDVTGARALEAGGFHEASAAVLAVIEVMGDEMRRRPLAPATDAPTTHPK